MKKVGFIIINYNSSKDTINLLNAIKNFDILDLIVVLDNNSTDNSYEILKQYENDKIKVIKTETNKGYGAGINFASNYLLKELNDAYIIISNSDIEIKSNEDIKTLINRFKDNNIAVVGPTIIEDNKLSRGWKNSSPFYDGLCNLPLISRIFRDNSKYKNNYYNKDITDVEIVNGCFFIFDGTYANNLFDENMFLYYEENVLYKKMNNLNKQIVIDNTVKIFHHHSKTISKNVNRINKYKILKSSQYYFQKKYNNANLISRIWLKVTAFISLIILHIRCIFNKK